MNMTSSSVPDSFSMDDLEKAMESAPNEELLHATVGCNDDKECSPDYINHIAQEAIINAGESCPGPLVHKVMMMAICSRMISWHTHMGEMMYEDGNQEAGACWLRDAGKFQSMMDSLVNITVGDDDFTCNYE